MIKKKKKKRNRKGKERSTVPGTKALGRGGERSDSALAFKGQTCV